MGIIKDPSQQDFFPALDAERIPDTTENPINVRRSSVFRSVSELLACPNCWAEWASYSGRNCDECVFTIDDERFAQLFQKTQLEVDFEWVNKDRWNIIVSVKLEQSGDTIQYKVPFKLKVLINRQIVDDDPFIDEIQIDTSILDDTELEYIDRLVLEKALKDNRRMESTIRSAFYGYSA